MKASVRLGSGVRRVAPGRCHCYAKGAVIVAAISGECCRAVVLDEEEKLSLRRGRVRKTWGM